MFHGHQEASLKGPRPYFFFASNSASTVELSNNWLIATVRYSVKWETREVASDDVSQKPVYGAGSELALHAGDFYPIYPTHVTCMNVKPLAAAVPSS